MPSATVSADGTTSSGAALESPASDSTVTNAAGEYSFDQLGGGAAPPTQMGWTIVPRKSGDHHNAIGTEDAACVLQYVVGRRALDRYGRFASDATGNGSVTTHDATQILKFAAGIENLPVTSPSRCASDWAFFPIDTGEPNQDVFDPLVTASDCRPGRIVLDPLSQAAVGQDFLAVLFGDCDGSWSPQVPAGTGASALASSTSEPPVVRLGTPRRLYPRRVRVPIYVSGADFSSFRLRVKYDSRRLRADGIRTTSRQTSALAVANTSIPGEITVAIASADPIRGEGSAVAVLDFTTRGRARSARPPRLIEATVNDQPVFPASDPLR